MTDGQSEACLWNDPDYGPDGYPFWREVERRRIETERENRGSWIEETRRRIRAIDEEARERHENE